MKLEDFIGDYRDLVGRNISEREIKDLTGIYREVEIMKKQTNDNSEITKRFALSYHLTYITGQRTGLNEGLSKNPLPLPKINLN